MDYVELVPVSEWVFNLYRVKFLATEGGRLLKTRFCVTTETHIGGEVNDPTYLPRDCGWIEWETVKQDVARPSSVGVMYGQRIDESGWATGERMACELAIWMA